MQIEEFLVELKASLRHYDKRDIIDDASIYRWIEIALKKFGGDITIPKDIVLDVKRKQAVMPGDYYDLILAYRCDFAGYEVPGGKEVIPELQNTFAWKERTERSYRWRSCEECCKEECEKTIVEKFYINTPKDTYEVRCHYRKPVPLKLAKPMMKDMCLTKQRNMFSQDSPFEINIINGSLFANFDGPVYIKYKALPFDGKGEIFIPDTPLGLLADYIENYVKMRLFEEWMYNGEVAGAGDMFKLYMQQDLIKLKNARAEVKSMNWTLSDYYKLLQRNRERYSVYEKMTPMINNVVKII